VLATRTFRAHDRRAASRVVRMALFHSGASPRQAVLPTGTLWCRDVTIGRTGEQFYHASEINADADAGSGGIIRVQRDADEVFDERSMAASQPINGRRSMARAA
jgi:hypothetical protein